MRIWVTRPSDDATEFAAALKARGHVPVIEPLFELAPLADATMLDAVAAFAPDYLLATSRNSIRALLNCPNLPQLLAVPLLAVGPGTAAIAEKAKFKEVVEGAGRADDLLPLIKQLSGADNQLTQQSARVAFLRGAEVTTDLAAALTTAGYATHSSIVYRMVPTRAPSSTLAANIVAGEIEGVALFSPKAARHYVHKVETLNLTHAVRPVLHFCLSKRIAAEISHLQPVATKVAKQPNVQEMLELIGGPTGRSMH